MDYRKTIEHLRRTADTFEKSGYGVDGIAKCFKESADAIEQLAEELKQYKDKEEQGLLISLPCKIGDDVFVIPSEVNYKLNKSFGAKGLNAVCRQVVDHIEFNSYGYWISTCDGMQGHRQESFGETWFLTEAEAEEALARMKGE